MKTLNILKFLFSGIIMLIMITLPLTGVMAQPPANDVCTGAIPVTVGTTGCTVANLANGTLAGATGVTDATCTGTEDDDVWFSFVANATSQNIALTLQGSTSTATFDFVHQVYSGTCTSLTNLYCSDPNTSCASTFVVGQTYYIRVYSWTATAGQTQTFSVCVTAPSPPPANDACTGAIPVTVGTTGCTVANLANGTLAGATGVADAACTGTEDDDVWFSFVANATTQNIALTLQGSTSTATFDFVHQVYSGSCASLTSLYCSDPNTSSATTFVVGQTYYIRVYSWTATACQTQTFSVCVTAPPPPPANDACTGAIPVTVGTTGCTVANLANGTLAGATGVADATCTGTEDDDVWFSFVANATTQNITLTVPGTTFTSPFDFVHQVYSGTCAGLTSLYCSDPNTSSATTFVVGQTYYIRVYSWTATTGQTETFSVCVTAPPPPPANDVCTSAIVLPCNGTVSGSNISTVTNSDQPTATCTTAPGTNGVWYTFTGTGNSETIATCGFDTKLNVYTGTCGAANLTCVIGNDDFAVPTCTATNFESQVTFTSTLGTTYYILVTGLGTATGNFTLTHTGTCPPPACLAAYTAPSNGASGLTSPQTISWPAAPTATSYDVYFGPSTTPPFVINTTATSYSPGALIDGTYSWIIIPRNASGAATGCVRWSFTIGSVVAPSISVAETSGAAANDATICAGSSATLNAVGGGTYAWSTNETTSSITVTPATTTTYTVTVTPVGGTPTPVSQTITVIQLPIAGITVAETSGTTNNDGTICLGASATLTGTGGGTYLWSTGVTTGSIMVTPATTTTYSVTVTNLGCTASTSRTITVNPLPVPAIAVTETSGNVSNDGIICAGSPTTLTASGGATYLWSTGATTNPLNVSPLVTTTYTVTATSAVGCSATATRVITATPLPIITVTASPQAICKGSSSTLTATVTNPLFVPLSFTNTADFSIPDNNTTGITSPIVVSGIPGTVGSTLQNVKINITHTWDSDLDISLQCPDGNIIDLSSDNGGSGDNYINTMFMTGSPAVTGGAAPFTGSYSPEQPFSLLSGCTANGTWNLIVKDDLGADLGTLLDWTITFSVPATYTYTWAPGASLSSTSGSTVLASPTSSTTYTVTVTDSNGCSTTGSVAVRVHIPEPLICEDHVNISLNETCRASGVLSMFTEHSPTDLQFYEIIYKNPAGKVIAESELGNYKGQLLTVSVRDICDGNSCWGTLTVEDKLAPRINCGPVRSIQCYEVDALVAEDVTKKSSPSTAKFAPTWSDNCGAVTAEFTTHKLLDGCNGGNVLRKWTVTDASGNTAYCEQWFEVETEVDWTCPDQLVLLSCKDDLSPEAIAIKEGVGSAYPYFRSGNITTPIHGVCNYYTTYSDVEIDACGAHCHGNKKVIRTWQILDWCNGTVTPCQQIIKSVDTEAPTFIVKDTIISTAPWYCEGDFYVPNPWELHDNCDINPTWTVKSSVVGVQIVPALLNGAPHPVYKYRAIGVPKGSSHLKYTATDCCGNEVTIISNVTVVDKTPPVPVAKRDIVIGLVGGYDATGKPDGTAKLYSESIDNGSYDNCSAVRLEIRRVNKGVKSDNVTTDAPSCGNLGNGNPQYNNNITFNNRLAANLGNNMPYNTNDTDGGLFVKFCCEDLTSAGADFDGDGTLDVGYHMVIMRVWDDGNMDGIVGNAGDNWNDTWANVKVECKVPPVITCPADATIHCDWAIEKFVSSSATKSIAGVDFQKTGIPEAYGVCTNPEIQFRDREVTDQCGIGFIERTFVVKEKDITRTCVQRITILPSTSAQPWVTNFPGDWDNVEQIGCDEPTAKQIKDKGPTNVGGPCDVIGVSTKIELFNFEDGVCKKWKVEYKYVNWCTNEERGPFYKYFMYSDEAAPVVTCRDTMYAVDVNCELKGLQLTNKATDTGGCIDNGWLKWTVIVDLWADGTDDIEYTSFIAPNNDVSNMRNGNFDAIRDDNENGIPDVYVAPTANGAAIPANSIILPTIAGKMSNHKVAWKVTDGCHNFATCHSSFMVADKKAPTPVCVPLSTALMQDPDGSGPLLPMVELWAIDFMNKSYDNCTDESDLLYTFDDWAPRIADTVIQTRLVNVDKAHYFNSKGQAVAAYPARSTNSVEKAAEASYLAGNLQLWIPENRSAAKVWVSGDIAPGVKKTVDVHVTVWDKKFNHDYCWTTLDLILNVDEPIGSRIAGFVMTEKNQPVSNVNVNIDANITEYPKTVSTAVAGTYDMMVASGLDYQITASKGGDYLNGVSTLDLVLIQRHILGIQTLDSPYKLIAADANNDGKVTASDLTELRKLILGVTNALPKNASWRFPISAQSMDATNPFPFVEQIAISQILTNMSNQNFVAVKIGDVNGNVSTNVSNPAVEGRSNRNVVMAVAEQTIAAGEVVEIPVTAANFSDVAGYQFTMNLKGGSYVGVNAGALDINASNVGVIAGDVVTMSYASNEGTSIHAGEVLFTLIVKADKAGNVSEMITLNSGVTAAESYSSDLTVGKVSLDVRTAPVAGIELNQNEPNPFKGQTTVSFVMPEAATATLSVYDVTGKVVTVRNIDANKGLNSEIFTREQLGATGVLYYTLKSGDFTATKKMIIVE